MWFEFGKKGKEKNSLTPPAGMTAADIATQSSICTGEMLIGFLDSKNGRLLQAVVVRNETDIAAFYRAYGYEPPCRN